MTAPESEAGAGAGIEANAEGAAGCSHTSVEPPDMDAYVAATEAFAESTRPRGATESLEQRFARVGRALDTLRAGLSSCCAEARQSALEAALAPAVAHLATEAAHLLLGDGGGDAWNGDTSKLTLCAVARAWDVALASGPVDVRRYSALLYSETAHLFDGVVPRDAHAWLMERARTILEGLGETDAESRARAYLAHIARGQLPYGMRPEDERDVPQLHVSCVDMLDPRTSAHVLALQADTRRWLMEEARRRHDALKATPLDDAAIALRAERKRTLKHLAAIEQSGGVPPGFTAALS